MGGGVQFWNAGILCRNNPSRCCMINGRAQCAIQTMNLKQGLGGLIPLPHLLSCVYGPVETSEHTYTHTYIHDIIEKSKWYSVRFIRQPSTAIHATESGSEDNVPFTCMLSE